MACFWFMKPSSTSFSHTIHCTSGIRDPVLLACCRISFARLSFDARIYLHLDLLRHPPVPLAAISPPTFDFASAVAPPIQRLWSPRSSSRNPTFLAISLNVRLESSYLISLPCLEFISSETSSIFSLRRSTFSITLTATAA